MVIAKKKLLGLTLPLVALFSYPLSGMAESFTGKLNGHECAHAGVSCPSDRLDPHIALESDFVLMLSNGDYMFLPNLSRDIKARYVLQTVQVEGNKHKKFNSIKVNEFKVKKGGSYKTTWSQASEDFERRLLYEENYE